MCDCKRRIEAKLLEHFKAQEPTGVAHDVELQGYGFAVLDGKTVEVPFAPYKASAMVPLKKGGARLKKATGYMHFSHCPYCGEKIAKQAVEEATHA